MVSLQFSGGADLSLVCALSDSGVPLEPNGDPLTFATGGANYDLVTPDGYPHLLMPSKPTGGGGSGGVGGSGGSSSISGAPIAGLTPGDLLAPNTYGWSLDFTRQVQGQLTNDITGNIWTPPTQFFAMPSSWSPLFASDTSTVTTVQGNRQDLGNTLRMSFGARADVYQNPCGGGAYKQSFTLTTIPNTP